MTRKEELKNMAREMFPTPGDLTSVKEYFACLTGMEWSDANPDPDSNVTIKKMPKRKPTKTKKSGNGSKRK